MKRKFINGVTDYDSFKEEFIKENQKYLQRLAVVNAMSEKERLTLADEIALVAQIGVSRLTGKLDGFWAVSTSVLMNRLCQARALVEGSICADCYAAQGAVSRDGLALVLEINYMIINRWRLSPEAWATLPIPSINGKSRGESHGDVATVCAAVNMCNICASHPYLTFGVWTKNLNLYRAAFKEVGKPKNMIFIYSSPIKNQVAEVPEDMKPYVDKVFTVFEKDYIEKNHICINCAKHCNGCLKCYNQEDSDFYINEILK